MNTAEEPQWDWTEVGLFLGLGLPCFFAVFATGVWFMTFLGVTSKGLRLLLPQFVGYAAALVPLWMIFERRRGLNPVEALRLRIPQDSVGPALLRGVTAAMLVLAVSVLLRMPKIETPMEELLQDTPSLIVAGICGITIGPWFEELIFRGLLQPLLTRVAGIAVGITLAALPFALLHGPQYAWSWRHVLLITLAGVAFGWQRWRTDSTGAAALMHGAYNAVLFGLFIVGRLLNSRLPEFTKGSGW